jgi:hypothetical protein
LAACAVKKLIKIKKQEGEKTYLTAGDMTHKKYLNGGRKISTLVFNLPKEK